MRTIGLIGGMSWESSAEYYRIINQEVRARLGGLHSADCLMYSFDFAEIERLQMTAKWDEAAHLLVNAAQKLESGGAACIILCTNTMHRLADKIQAAISLPFIHIADPTAEAVHAAGVKSVGLLGTRFTMEGEFYRGRLEDRHNLNVLIPTEEDRALVHRVIYEELTQGIISPESRTAYLGVIERLQRAGAEGIILGCTEIGLLIKPEDTALPVFDTTLLHAHAAVDFALGQQSHA